MKLFSKFETTEELATPEAIINKAKELTGKEFTASKAKLNISSIFKDLSTGEKAISKSVEIWSSFSTPEPPDDTPLKPNGEKYKTVVINGKKWLAENYINIPTKGETFTPTYNGTEYPEYGLIYDVDALLAVKESLVGTGWHIPTIEEWESVMKYAYENYKDGVNTEESTSIDLSSIETTYSEGGLEFYKISSASTEGKPCPAVAALVGDCIYNTIAKCSTANATGLGLLPCGRNSGTACEATQQGCYWNSYNLENITGNVDKKQTSYHYFQLNNGHYMYGRTGKGYYCAIRLVHD